MSRILFFFVIPIAILRGAPNSPTHCTEISIDSTDYSSAYKLEYPVSYIAAGQREGYQQLYCVNPPAVKKAYSIVCDWAAPPQVHFTLGDEHMHVVRQDPSGQYLGMATLNTYQYCGHNMSTVPSTTTTTTEAVCYLSDRP